MSQLDLSISFSQFSGLLILFYIFLFFLVSIIISYWYNKKIREFNEGEVKLTLVKKSNSIELIKNILKL